MRTGSTKSLCILLLCTITLIWSILQSSLSSTIIQVIDFYIMTVSKASIACLSFNDLWTFWSWQHEWIIISGYNTYNENQQLISFHLTFYNSSLTGRRPNRKIFIIKMRCFGINYAAPLGSVLFLLLLPCV